MARTRGHRAVRPKHEELAPAAYASALADARRTYGRRKGVVSVHWALKVVDGRSTPSVALTIMVESKLPSELVVERSRIPEAVEVPTLRGVLTIPTDVVQCQPASKHGVRPGRRSRVRGILYGQLSAVRLEGESGSVFLPAHVAGPPGTAITARAPGSNDTIRLGQVGRSRNDPWIDGAVVLGTSRAVAIALSTNEHELRTVDRADIGLPVFVLLTRKSQRVTTSIHGTGVRVTFANGAVMLELIELEDDISIPGDSGAPVVDEASRIIGFIVGSNGRRTYVLPAKRALDV